MIKSIFFLTKAGIAAAIAVANDDELNEVMQQLPSSELNHGSEKIIETATRRPPHPLGCRHVLLEAESVESSGV